MGLTTQPQPAYDVLWDDYATRGPDCQGRQGRGMSGSNRGSEQRRGPGVQTGRPGFTLIELLVVIAVISILVGILLPAMVRTLGAGYTARCQSNLRQWGSIILMATDGTDGKFADGADGWSRTVEWWEKFCADEYNDLRMCPMAPRGPDFPFPSIGSTHQSGATFQAWGFKSEWGTERYGSYGANKWAWKWAGDPGRKLSWLTPHVACAAEGAAVDGFSR